MTAASLPSFILAMASSFVASTSVTPWSAANPVRSCAAAAEPSSSAQPSVMFDVPLPWKMSPNITMKTIGKASVQKSAARSRV